MRAFVGEPGAEYRETIASASQAAAAGGVTTIVCQPDTDPAIDDPAMVDFVLRRARDTAIVHVHPMAALTKGCAGEEMTEIGLLKAAGAVAFTDGREERHQCAGDAPRAHLCARLRRADRPSHRRSRPRRRRRDERGRVRRAARPRRRADSAAETIMLERDMRLVALTAEPLPRGLPHLRGIARRAAPRQGAGPRGHRGRLDQPSHARTRSMSAPTAPSASSARRCARRTTARRWSRRSPPA